MGLGSEYWHEVIEVLRKIIPVYDKVNMVVSFGTIQSLREYGIKMLVNKLLDNDDPIILDAGSGYGNMSYTLLKMNNNVRIVMIDPIAEMLMLAKERLPKLDKASSIFEYLPFKDKIFDGIMCGYSFRDSLNYNNAIEEFARVLKDDGILVIVDLTKPDNRFYRSAIGLYLKIGLPFLAFIVAGRLGLMFKAVYGTWKKMPTNNYMIKSLSKRFRNVEKYTILFGGASVFIAYK